MERIGRILQKIRNPGCPYTRQPGRAYSVMAMALTGQALAASTAAGTVSGGSSPDAATANVPSMVNTSGHRPAHWVQPMQRSGSTNAFIKNLLSGKAGGSPKRTRPGIKPVWTERR